MELIINPQYTNTQGRALKYLLDKETKEVA